MVEIIPEFIKASELFETEKQELMKKRKYRSVKSLLAFSEELVSKTSEICDAYGSGIIALGITDLIAARTKKPEEVFNKMLRYFENIDIVSNVNTESLRYKTAVCLSIYLDNHLTVNSIAI